MVKSAVKYCFIVDNKFLCYIYKLSPSTYLDNYAYTSFLFCRIAKCSFALLYYYKIFNLVSVNCVLAQLVTEFVLFIYFFYFFTLVAKFFYFCYTFLCIWSPDFYYLFTECFNYFFYDFCFYLCIFDYRDLYVFLSNPDYDYLFLLIFEGLLFGGYWPLLLQKPWLSRRNIVR